MAKKETTGLVKKNWIQNFNLVGEAKISDYTFKTDEKSTKSDWVYNSLNLGVDCGEKHGTVFCELMGGFGSERDNVVYVHGKKEDGSDDFENSYTIDWDDRLDERFLKDVGDLCFITVGLEKDAKEKTFYKKFLTPYDAIAYVNEHLKDGMVVNVKGQLRYTVYNDTVQCRKEVNSIVLSNATPDKYKATFTQTMLLDRDSCTRDNIKKDKSGLTLDAYVLEKFKEFNGHDLTENGKIKGGQFVPLRKSFEYEFSEAQQAKIVKIIEALFKVKKGVTQVTFEGVFVESGATVTTTLDDIPEDIKELIELNVYTEEEALAKCSENGSKEKRMILRKPYTKLVGEEGKKTAVIQKFEEMFEEEDLMLDCLTKKEEDDDDVDTDVDTDEEVREEEESLDDDSWLNNL